MDSDMAGAADEAICRIFSSDKHERAMAALEKVMAVKNEGGVIEALQERADQAPEGRRRGARPAHRGARRHSEERGHPVPAMGPLRHPPRTHRLVENHRRCSGRGGGAGIRHPRPTAPYESSCRPAC